MILDHNFDADSDTTWSQSRLLSDFQSLLDVVQTLA